MKRKEYGNTNTKLKLSEKAQEVFSKTSPIHIYEEESDEGLFYIVEGVCEGTFTEEGVNELLESFAPDTTVEDVCRQHVNDYICIDDTISMNKTIKLGSMHLESLDAFTLEQQVIALEEDGADDYDVYVLI